MAKRMLIDAAHPEETRVVVTSGTRLEEFDFESSTKKQVKGNIYLAKVTRVEPSLQAAFVDYGGNRHGFLAFSEIHPDYYRIPVSDRHGEDAEPLDDGHAAEDDGDEAGISLAVALPEPVLVPDSSAADDDAEAPEGNAAQWEWQPDADAAGDEPPVPPAFQAPAAALAWEAPPAAVEPPAEASDELPRDASPDSPSETAHATSPEPSAEASGGDAAEPAIAAEWEAEHAPIGDSAVIPAAAEHPTGDKAGEPGAIALRSSDEPLVTAEVSEFTYRETDNEVEAQILVERQAAEAENVETFGGDEVEEVEEADAERRRTHPARHYKIQEVIKRRQIMLVQVGKEERGNKGAALTTYLSLAGRYCVLMPNTNRGGGVSRKITSISDRRRLKDILEDLEIPEGMGVIVRTAGAERSKAEIKRDYEYLLRLWNEIRELTLKSTAPALIYEEGNLIKRSIRDLYTRDIDEVLVEGEEGYKTAKAFMRTLMPSHAKRVQPYRDPQVGLFHKFQIESQIDAVHSPVAQLRSGGYVVINQTEALVSIDVNSGRSTRERNIEETATRTNLEAAEEIARQLRLRDLAGLIVIDFIDMEEHRNQISVERRLKDALKNDRARIQVGRISPFGLLEMSRQRLRPSLAEASTQPCPHCAGTGFIRSVESTALYVLRSIEEEGSRRRSAEICLYVPTNVALYILNQKRESLTQIEARYGIKVMVARDDSLIPPAFRLERLQPYGAGEAPPLRPIQAPTLTEVDEDEDEDIDEAVELSAESEAATTEDGTENGEDERNRRRRRRRRRRVEEGREGREPRRAESADETQPAAEAEPERPAREEDESDADKRRRRRGRRGGRVRPRREEGAEGTAHANGSTPAAETVEIVAAGSEPQPDGEDHQLPPLETWPAERGIETASLAPFAGEAAAAPPAQHETAEGPVDRHVWHPYEPQPAPTAEAEQGIPFVGEAERVLEIAEAQHHPVPTAEAQQPSPFVAEAERVLEEVGANATPAPAEAGAEPPRPAENVLEITEKPANPRRGWWQRLIQQ